MSAMRFSFGTAITQNFDAAIRQEWLETNGLGGWASSSIIGTNTRRYHGLLVAAMQPPGGRVVLLSRLDETIVSNGTRFELASNQYPGAIHPTGFKHQTLFQKGLFPVFEYSIDTIRLRKTIAAVHGENTTLIIYDVLAAREALLLDLQPFIAARDYHSLAHANESIQREADFSNGLFKVRAYDSVPDLFIKVPGASFEPDPDWYRNVEYRVEQVRGLDFQEDMFTHGLFRVTLETGDQLGVVVSTEDPRERNAFELLEQEKSRRLELLETVPGQDDLVQTLALAADQFIVQRDRDFKTITVEINALWYNAQAILQCLYSSVGEKTSAQRFAQRAERMKDRFQREFWYDEGGHLYDWVHGDTRDASIRPNQIFALSLPFPLLEGQQAKMVFETITKKLWTPFGLRSLAPEDPHYRPVYQGNGFERDSAYHQGTVWAWLLGPWITALVRFNGQEGKAQAKKYLREMIRHFQDAGIGTVSEIFDAEWPHTPRGCIAQAWSVAEVLRAYVEDVLD